MNKFWQRLRWLASAFLIATLLLALLFAGEPSPGPEGKPRPAPAFNL